MQLNDFIRDIPDWPKPGIVFKDITPLLKDPTAMAEAVQRMAAPYRDQRIDIVTGAESRGFIFGIAVAQALSAGFVPLRKPGKLPAKTISAEYDLEYGSATLAMHVDAIAKGQRVLMVDDLLATGGTMAASCQLVQKVGGRIAGICVLIELTFLHGREKLTSYGPVHSIIQV